MKLTRRDVLTLAGGSIMGALFTPVPWKALDDTAIWTQNWSLIPRLPRGRVTSKFSACTLCPGGCALTARCVNGMPVSLAGVRNHPVTHGTVCPVGLAGHHVPFHPLRISRPYRFSDKTQGGTLAPVSIEDVVADLGGILRPLAASGADGAVAILDQRPGRAIAGLYGRFLNAFPNRLYLRAPVREDGTLERIRTLAREPLDPLGFDFENTSTILSFGAPLLDGWGTPGRMNALLERRRSKGLKIIQVESVQSRTALQADTWLPITPGTEAAFAFGLAHVLLRDGLFAAGAGKSVADFESYREAIAQFHPHKVSAVTGIDPNVIIDVARALGAGPSIILSSGDPGGGPFDPKTEAAIAGLNILLGSPGRKGGIVVRQDMPDRVQTGVPLTSLADVPDNSIRVLIIDGSSSGYAYPASLIAKKMTATGGVVVSMSPYLSAASAGADYLVPVPAHLEALEDVITPAGAVCASLSISTPLLPKQGMTTDPAVLLGSLSRAAGIGTVEQTTTEAVIKDRVRAIHASRRGMVFSPVSGSTTDAATIASPDELWQALTDGGCWLDSPVSQRVTATFALLDSPDPRAIADALQTPKTSSGPLSLMPRGWKGATTSGAISPILSKVFQESDLRSIAGRVAMNPGTAASANLAEGDQAILETEQGRLTVLVTMDPGVMPGILAGVVGPLRNKTPKAEHLTGDGVLALCRVREDGTWRFTQATIVKA